MLPGYPFLLDAYHWAVVVFVLAMTFLSGALGGFFFGLTHALRHGEGDRGSKSIWTFDEEG
jgi:hypothetical protein